MVLASPLFVAGAFLVAIVFINVSDAPIAIAVVAKPAASHAHQNTFIDAAKAVLGAAYFMPIDAFIYDVSEPASVSQEAAGRTFLA